MRAARLLAGVALVLTAAVPVRAASASLLTPELLVEAPQPGAAVVNAPGTDALVPVATPNATSGVARSSLYHVHIPAPGGETRRDVVVLTRDVSEPVFLDASTAAYLGNRTLYQQTLAKDDARTVLTFPTDVRHLRAVPTGEHAATLVFAATVYGDGDLAHADKEAHGDKMAEWSRVKVYDTLLARHWDQWMYHARRSQLFAVDLVRHGDEWHPDGGFRNLLQHSALECPVGVLGGATDFAVSERWVAFAAKDPDVDPAWNTKQNVYIVPLAGGAAPRKISCDGRGWAGAPALSPDGDTVAFLQQYKNGYESDRKVLQTFSLRANAQAEQLADWDRSPNALAFARDGTALFLLTPDNEQVKVFRSTVQTRRGAAAAVGPREVLVANGSTSAVTELPDGAVVHATSTMHHPMDLFRRACDGTTQRLTHFLHASPAHRNLDLGAEPRQFSYAGDENVTVHGWLLRPPRAAAGDATAHPLAVLIHGGPEGDWGNAWSTRWNPSVFAAAGFVVVALDPSGSTSFGQQLTDRVLRHWGDRPFRDIRAGVRHVLESEAGVDRTRVVAAGASYGGYMVNWIQGHNDDGLFKALVTHDGVFNTMNNWYATDELYFPEAEFNGVPWENEEEYMKFSPHRYASQWNTPHLIVHGGRDYRLDDAEGIAAFNTLQRRGVPSRLVFFPDEGHWILDARNALTWHREVLGWLSKWVRGDRVPDAAPPDAALVFQHAAGAPVARRLATQQ
ncbi:hypothetical protein MSPP1_004204 [Malassezia sp. CBS 17886]|nr:hypothetical protein MSPP1_004204 [Malassezia sp. CBS 17886]